jgi:predicted signal transduction protein with EAL and GGDEF domain
LTIGRAHGGETMVEHRCTVSIGVALFDHNEVDGDDIVRRADAAMYQAKECGRNAIRFDAMSWKPDRPDELERSVATTGVEGDERG